MKALAALVLAMASGAAAGQTLILHYSERAPLHYTGAHGELAGDAAKAVTDALTAAGIAYEIRRTPAKYQLVRLRENREPACMMSWIRMLERDRKGKFSDVIQKGTERRLWCGKMVPDDVLKRFNAALAAQRVE